ncbi:MAG: DUF2612 domain-containing protein [Syntrophomonadaceae bacterium]|nr:DUF2612 domain-containing protein [Syntrophomonadaceae bacterium]
MSYTDLITSEHAQKPKFTALVSALTGPMPSMQSALNGVFDLDVAVGEQLDFIGQWVGISRNLKTPITDVFFSLDIAPGLDSGIVWTPYTPTQGLEQLPDDQYRLVIRARILNNQWDGSLTQAYAIYDALFAGSALVPFIQDNADLTMYIGLTGAIPDALTLAMLTQGLLNAKPGGVRVLSYVTPSANAPIFALDVQNTSFAGLDSGAIAVFNAPQ